MFIYFYKPFSQLKIDENNDSAQCLFILTTSLSRQSYVKIIDILLLYSAQSFLVAHTLIITPKLCENNRYSFVIQRSMFIYFNNLFITPKLCKINKYFFYYTAHKVYLFKQTLYHAKVM